MIINPAKNKARRGMTIMEVLTASLLLTIAMVPILRALTNTHVIDIKIERRTRSLTLAEAKLEDIRARSIYGWSTDFSESSLSLEGSYLCTVADSAVANLRKMSVSVGYDDNANGVLDSSEVEVTLATMIARRW